MPDDYELMPSDCDALSQNYRNLLYKSLKEKLDALKIQYEIKSRTKSIHSIMLKMKKQGVENTAPCSNSTIQDQLSNSPTTSPLM